VSTVRKPYAPYGTTTCDHCRKSITLTKTRTMRAHGPANKRCPGSGK
jgi:hypothetical protein